jgi:4'-phosphopantetheinyl transferase EntD
LDRNLSTMAQQARPGFWPGFTGPGPGRAGRPVWPSLVRGDLTHSESEFMTFIKMNPTNLNL